MTNEELQELCVVDARAMHIYDFATPESAEAIIAEARRYAAQSRPSADYRVMTLGEFLKLEREKLLGDPLEEITAERFDEMLDILPPLAWTTRHGVEMFCMSEFFTGTYTSQYAHDHATGKYYTKMVDYRDPSTWICEILYPAA